MRARGGGGGCWDANIPPSQSFHTWLDASRVNPAPLRQPGRSDSLLSSTGVLKVSSLAAYIYVPRSPGTRMEIEPRGERGVVSEEEQRSASALKVSGLIMRHGWSCREHITNSLVFLVTSVGSRVGPIA